MILENWFSTPIWYTKIQCDLTQVKQKCYQLKNEGEGVHKSNFGGWQSKTINLTDYEEFKELTQLINENLNNVCKDIHEDFKLLINGAWVNINGKNSYNYTHEHPFSALSGCFYIDVPENSGNIVFENMHSLKRHYPINTFNSPLFYENTTYKPDVGSLIIFPSWINHKVETNNSDNDRISIAFNTTQF